MDQVQILDEAMHAFHLMLMNPSSAMGKSYSRLGFFSFARTTSLYLQIQNQLYKSDQDNFFATLNYL